MQSFLSFFCTLIIHTQSWVLPPTNFLNDFALNHNRASIIIYLPETDSKTWIKLHQRSFESFQSDSPVTIMYVFSEKLVNISWVTKAKEDLHIFIPDDESPSIKAASIKKFITIFNMRERFHREIWLLDTSSWSTNEDVSTDHQDELMLDVDDDLYWYTFDSMNMNNLQNAQFDIWEVYRIQDGYPITINQYGNWSNSHGLISNPIKKWNRRKDLQMAHFDILAMPSSPYTTAMIPLGEGLFEMEGMFAEIFFDLQGILNFTFQLRKPPDGQYGALQPDGTWNGMVRIIQDKQADIAVASFTVTMDRSTVITFAQPITQIYHSLFIKNPTGSYNLNAYVEPLTHLSWAFIGIFALVVSPILFLTTSYGERDPKYYEFTLPKSYLFTLSTLTMRGWSDTPTTAASRLAFISLLIGSTMIYWHWEAMLISYLATRVIVLPFNSIPELMDKSDYLIALTPGSSYEDAFKLSTDPIWQDAWNNRIKDYLVNYQGKRGTEQKMIVIDNPSIALYTNYFGTDGHFLYTDCQLIAIPAKYDYKPYAFAFQKDSPYLGLFNHFLKEMKERGALKKVLNKYQSQPQVCPDSSGLPLGFDNCFTAFMAWIAGLSLGIVLLLIELCSRWTGLNLQILEMYDRRDPEMEKDAELPNLFEHNKDAMIARLRLDNYLLKKRLMNQKD